jgi:hypothetical protein
MSDVRSAAYDRIDRFLRDNLDDRDYAPYAEALDVLWEPPLAHAAVIEAAKKRTDAELAAEESMRKMVNIAFPIFLAAATTPTEATP